MAWMADTRGINQYDRASHFASIGMSRHSVSGPSGGPAGYFRQSALLLDRGDAVGLSQARENSRASNYTDYGYTDQQPYAANSFPNGSLQGHELQPYQSDFSRQHHTLREQQRDQDKQSLQQPSPHQFSPYEPGIVYNLNQQSQTPAPYNVVPPYQARQSAAIEALSSQFAVPQYFPSSEPTGTGVHPVVSPYLASHEQSAAAYNQPAANGCSSTTQPFTTTMAEFTPIGTAGHLEQQQQQQQSQQSPASAHQQQKQQQQQPIPKATSVEEAYGQFQHALMEIFDRIRAGRLSDASHTLLEISGWLVTNAHELGILRDDQLVYSDRLQLWSNFNICWLAVCQKQKDLTQDLLRTGHQLPSANLLSVAAMEHMGNELIRLCDQMEQYGLVDYQMGIWEEEILCVICRSFVSSGSML